MDCRRFLVALAAALLLGGCGISALVPTTEMPSEQQASIVFQRAVLAPLTLGGSEIAIALAGGEMDRREAALRAPGGLGAAADRAAAEAAYQEHIRPGLAMEDPFTRFILAARLWLAGEVDAGRLAPAAVQEAVVRIRGEVWASRARRENFAPAAVSLRRALWREAPGAALESLQRETVIYRQLRLDCPTERTWGDVTAQC